MTTRWEVEKAVLGSQLHPYARLLMLALLAKADNKTAAIPPDHTPSLTTLQAMTGLGRSSVTEWLGLLESAGWVRRTQPRHKERRERTLYEMAIGEPSVKRAERPSRIAKANRTEPHSGLELDRTADQLGRTAVQSESESSASARPHSGTSNGTTSAHSGLELDRTAARTRPHSGHASTKSSPTENSSTEIPPLADFLGDSGEAEAAETTQTILANFLDYCEGQEVIIPARLRGHYAKEIKTALDSRVPPLLVRRALYSMFTDRVVNRPSLLSNRIVQVQTGPERRNGQHKAHQNDPTVNYNEDL